MLQHSLMVCHVLALNRFFNLQVVVVPSRWYEHQGICLGAPQKQITEWFRSRVLGYCASPVLYWGCSSNKFFKKDQVFQQCWMNTNRWVPRSGQWPWTCPTTFNCKVHAMCSGGAVALGPRDETAGNNEGLFATFPMPHAATTRCSVIQYSTFPESLAPQNAFGFECSNKDSCWRHGSSLLTW